MGVDDAGGCVVVETQAAKVSNIAISGIIIRVIRISPVVSTSHYIITKGEAVRLQYCLILVRSSDAPNYLEQSSEMFSQLKLQNEIYAP